MGFSTKQMGAVQNPTPGGNVRVTYASDNNLTEADGTISYTRFSMDLDVQYNPSNDPINGVADRQFFDQIVLDGLLIGAELVDAASSQATHNLVAGEALGSDGRISIDYSGLLLNAPHIHSRYAGRFTGIIVAEMAMLARNIGPGAGIYEEFYYDPSYSNIAPFPALTTNILDIQH